ncbi:MAG: carbonic anhydrase [Methyloceanibacter sp.]
MCKNCDDSSLSRRHLMLGVGAAFASAAWSPRSTLAADEPPQNAINPDAALERLMQGNKRYAANEQQQRDCQGRRAGLVSAQYPIAAILSCSDSRVAPELAFDQGPGDLFVVRVAGNFVDDSGLASLEYAVKFLGVPLLMVLGHSNCGAVAAAVKVVKERAELPGHLPQLIKSIEPAVVAAHGRHPSDLVAAAIEENVKLNVKRMRDDEPILSQALAAKKIATVGGVYDLATGKVNLI